MRFVFDSRQRATLAALAVGIVIGAPAVALAQATPSEANLARGEAVYRASCALCHDNPTGRMPGRTVLRARDADFIFRALTDGSMRDVGSTLPEADREAVATFLTGRVLRRSADIDLNANMCRQPAPPMVLDETAWNGWGGVGVANARFQPRPGLAAADLAKLELKWAFALPGGIANPPTVAGGRVFIGNTKGVVFSLDAATGCTYWWKSVVAPTRAAITVGKLPDGRFAAFVTDWWGKVTAFNAETGAELWKVAPDDHPSIRLTGAPVLFENKLFVPVSSGEEGLAQDPAYVCCTQRGKLVALDAITGAKLWTAFTIDEKAAPVPGDGHRWGPAGASVWSAPAIDAGRRLIYVNTGNDHSDPATGASNAVIAYSLDTGEKRWTRQVFANDRFVGGCTERSRTRNCPTGAIGPDYGFGASPMMIRTGGGKDLIVAMSKSAHVYALDPDQDGRIVWQVRLGRGGMLGGVHWGGSADQSAIFVPISDYPYQDMSTAPLDGWSLSPSINAIAPDTGKVLWRNEPPKTACVISKSCDVAFDAATLSIPGVVFAGARDGYERAYSAKDGALLWEFDTFRQFDGVNGAVARGGALDHGSHAVANGMLFVASGTRAGNALLAFAPAAPGAAR